MRIVPLSYCPTLSEDDIYRHECSDRIWVPQHTFERWLLAEDVGTVVTVSLEGVPACMYAPHSGPRNIIYAPTWMCEELRTSLDPPTEDDDDLIVPERLQPPTCLFLQVQPHTSDHVPTSAEDPMPEDILSRAFEEYTCLREGQTVALQLPNGSRMFVTIVETQPQGSPVCIRTDEIAMDLLEALDTPQKPRLPTPPPSPPVTLMPEPEPEPEPQPLWQSLETKEERRQRLAAAAMARMQTQNIG